MDEPLSVIGTPRARTGHPVGQLFGLVSDGLYTSEDFDENGELVADLPIPSNPIGLAPGDIKYVDLNGDYKIDALDEAAIGGPRIPEIVYGFGINTRYKIVDFGVFFKVLQIRGRLQVVKTGYLVKHWAGNIFANIDDRWTEEN